MKTHTIIATQNRFYFSNNPLLNGDIFIKICFAEFALNFLYFGKFIIYLLIKFHQFVLLMIRATHKWIFLENEADKAKSFRENKYPETLSKRVAIFKKKCQENEIKIKSNFDVKRSILK